MPSTKTLGDFVAAVMPPTIIFTEEQKQRLVAADIFDDVDSCPHAYEPKGSGIEEGEDCLEYVFVFGLVGGLPGPWGLGDEEIEELLGLESILRVPIPRDVQLENLDFEENLLHQYGARQVHYEAKALELKDLILHQEGQFGKWANLVANRWFSAFRPASERTREGIVLVELDSKGFDIHIFFSGGPEDKVICCVRPPFWDWRDFVIVDGVLAVADDEYDHSDWPDMSLLK